VAWRILVDEDTADEYDVQLLRHRPDLEVRHVGKPGAPPLGLPDPEILVWCEDNDFLLLTGNRRTMPIHLAAHLNGGKHVAGILAIRRQRNIGVVIKSLLSLIEETENERFRDRIVYVPSVE
jgi:hypothetical protein